jgi:TolB-like protein/DNA-binding winged helix-turn-helix (wHTH) protein
MLSVEETIYYEFDDFRLDVENHRLLKNGKPVSLTNKAFLTLLILVRNSGQIVEKEDLISELWANSFVEESNLSQYIYTLRKVLGKDSSGNPYIETITKRGFRFSAQVRQIPPPVAVGDKTLTPVSEEFTVEQNVTKEINSTERKPTTNGVNGNHSHESSLAHPVADKTEKKTIPPSVPQRQTSGRGVYYFVGAMVLIVGLIFAAVLFYRNAPDLRSPQSQMSTPPDGIKSIAVLPFKTIGENNSEDKLGFGMADAIINRLSKLKRIPVRSTGAVLRYFDEQETDALKAGRELGVAAVLEGALQREGSRVRLSVQLTNVADGKSLWAESFNESSEDIFALQDSVAAKVAQSLELNLTREQEKLLAQRATNNPEAFQFYQTGLYFWNKRSKDSLEKAIENFKRAIELDPNYAQAYAGLADSYNMLGYYKFANEKEVIAPARQAAEKAVSLDSDLAEAHIALAYVEQYGQQPNLSFSARSLERAIELSPYNSTVRLRYAWLLLNMGNLEESVRQARLAQEYDPLSHVSNNVLCGFLSFQYKFEEAIPYCEKAVTITPNAPRARLVLAKVYFFNGREQDAFNQLQTQTNSSVGIDYLEALALTAYFHAKLGQNAEAQKILTTLESKLEEEPSLYNYLTLINYALGKKEEALKYHKKSIELKQLAPEVLRFRFDPIWEDVRADKRFDSSSK